jgi:hypothetical protein
MIGCVRPVFRRGETQQNKLVSARRGKKKFTESRDNNAGAAG